MITSSSVYVIYNPRFDMTKIGVSVNVKNRLSTLASSCGCDLELKYASPQIMEAWNIEGSLIKAFDKHKAKGEWFNGHEEEITEATEKACLGKIQDKRVQMYYDGEPISHIAEEHSVSRQAIIGYLRRAGVYKEAHISAVMEHKTKKAANKKKSDDSGSSNKQNEYSMLSFNIEDLNKKPDKNGYLGKNLKKSGGSYVVFDFKKGGWVKYSSIKEIEDVYNIKQPDDENNHNRRT